MQVIERLAVGMRQVDAKLELRAGAELLGDRRAQARGVEHKGQGGRWGHVVVKSIDHNIRGIDARSQSITSQYNHLSSRLDSTAGSSEISIVANDK